MQLYSITRRNNKAGKSIVHTHDLWEIILACGGSGSVVVEEKAYPFTAGTILCVPPGWIHYNTAPENYVHIAMRVRDFVSPSAKDEVLVFEDDVEKTFETVSNITLRVFFGRTAARELLLSSLYETLYGLLISWSEPQGRNEDIELVKNTMIANFSDPEFRAADAAIGVHYSDDYFRKLFRKETGVTLTQYLTGLRVKYAAKLLGGGGTGQQRVSDIALRAGFYDTRYFSRVFKAAYGVAPQEYREWVRTSEERENENER